MEKFLHISYSVDIRLQIGDIRIDFFTIEYFIFFNVH